jgi:hypothetical protein
VPLVCHLFRIGIRCLDKLFLTRHGVCRPRDRVQPATRNCLTAFLTSTKLTVIDSIEGGFNLSKLLVIDPASMNLDGLVVGQGRLVIQSY